MDAYDEMYHPCKGTDLAPLALCERDYPLMPVEIYAGVLTYACPAGERFTKSLVEIEVYGAPRGGYHLDCPREWKCR